MCCSVFQRVAVCCSALQCVAVWYMNVCIERAVVCAICSPISMGSLRLVGSLK